MLFFSWTFLRKISTGSVMLKFVSVLLLKLLCLTSLMADASTPEKSRGDSTRNATVEYFSEFSLVALSLVTDNLVLPNAILVLPKMYLVVCGSALASFIFSTTESIMPAPNSKENIFEGIKKPTTSGPSLIFELTSSMIFFCVIATSIKEVGAIFAEISV